MFGVGALMPATVRGRACSMFVVAALLALAGSWMYAAAALGAPTGTAPGVSPVSASTTAPHPGDVLTEMPTAVWSGTSPGIVRQWVDCDAAGLNCNPIPGANATTYTVTASDVAFTIEVQEIGTDGTGTTTLSSSPTQLVESLASQSAPSIGGTPHVGEFLTEIHGTWSFTPTSYTYQWLACSGATTCATIPNATDQFYKLTDNDRDKTIKVDETAYNGSASVTARSTATATVTLPPRPAATSSIDLFALPGGTVTNQPTTLVATVTSTTGSAPAGTVSFASSGHTIGGCSNLRLTSAGLISRATCQAAFSAAFSPARVTAAFIPAPGSTIAGSGSQPTDVAVSPDATTTTLDVSNPTVAVGAAATYTATVAATHPGAFTPSGTVQFRDGGKPIGTCAAQPLTRGQSGLTAQCAVRYGRTSSHRIVASYGGAAGFLPSSSAALSVSVHPLAVRVLGTITSKMHWEFFYAPRYTRVVRMVLRQALRGSRVVLRCHGGGCPFASRSITLSPAKRCLPRKGHRCAAPKPLTVDLTSTFHKQRLRAGAVLTVDLTRTHWIGKEYVFSTRAANAPRVRILCIAPSAKRPGVGC